MIIKAVILDFGGTLVEGGMEWEPYHRSIRALLHEKGHQTPLAEIKRALKASLDELHSIRETGKELTFEEVYADFLRRLGVPCDEDILDGLHDNFKLHYQSTYFSCTEDVLKFLSLKYKVALLSNTMSDQPHLLLNEAGYNKYFDVVICSRDIGVRKPNPEAFKIILEKLDVESENTVHVGDSVEADMFGAQSCGITGIWVYTPGEPSWRGPSINSICELPSFLNKLEETKQS